MKKLVLKQDSHAAAPYKITQVENTTEYSIGQRLTKDQLNGIMSRWNVVGGLTEPKGKVVIK